MVIGRRTAGTGVIAHGMCLRDDCSVQWFWVYRFTVRGLYTVERLDARVCWIFLYQLQFGEVGFLK